MRFYLAVLFLAVGLHGRCVAQETVPLRPTEPAFAIEVPEVILTDVPVSRISMEARDLLGNFDPTYNGRPFIQGIKLTVRGVDTKLPKFVDGRFELETDLAAGRKVYLTDDEVVVDPDNPRAATFHLRRINRWYSVLPPLIAVGLAYLLRNVLISLFAAIWFGATVLRNWNLFLGLTDTLDNFILPSLINPVTADNSHITIILFTLFLGATVGVMSAGGGTLALVNSLSRWTRTREHGQLMTWAMGLVIFFDDYANTLLVGSTMRPLTDRLKISREKLAFLIDSTAAPVAGLAVISTWVGIELSLIQDTYVSLGMDGNDVYQTFLASIPYRFYALHLLVFVWLISYTGNDFGPMLHAEARAVAHGQVARPGAVEEVSKIDSADPPLARRTLLRNALIPLTLLITLLMIGLWWTGQEGLDAANALKQGPAKMTASLSTILTYSNSNRVLLFASFLASIGAIAAVVTSRALTLQESVDAWLYGAKTMFVPVMILVLAWSVAALCSEEHLNTAGFLVEISQGNLSVRWMPTLAFIVSAAVAFATGSSWSTMGLLMPLSISVTFHLLVLVNDANPNHPLMLATIGGVLAGAIFGDHCSPISDTTVLSSAAAGVDHLDHVATQLPYAGSVALVSIFTGYLPAGFGYSPIILLPFGLIVLYILVQFLGRPVEEYAKRITDAMAAEEERLKAEAEAKAAAEAEE